MASTDPFEKSLSRSLKEMFIKQEDEVLRRILDTKVFSEQPQTLGKDCHKRSFNEGRRRVYRHWPRDPKGILLDGCPEGKVAPTSSPLWGATLHDIYWVNRIADCDNYISISSGSRLAAWAKTVGELSFAEDEIDWAENNEADPAVRHATDISDVIECRELMVMLCACGVSLKDDDLRADDGLEKDEAGESEKMDVDETKDKTDDEMVVEESNEKREQLKEEQDPAAYTPTKPFDYANYPKPWPLVPFSSKSPKLESSIPYHLLPEKLIVHDPFGLLHVATLQSEDYDYEVEDQEVETDWKAKTDITHTYSLRLTDSVKETITQERTKIADAAANADPIVLLTLMSRSTEGPSPVYPTKDFVGNAIEITVPPPPPPPSCTPEAHLYISPAEKLGRGHHSFVYRAEWDLPRSVFFKPTICDTCVTEAALDIIRKRDAEQKEAGLPVEGDASTEASSKGRFVERTKDFPSMSVDLMNVADLRNGDCVRPTPLDRTGIVEADDTVNYVVYEGPKTRVHVDSVPWYTAGMDPAPCNHKVSAAGPLPGPVPPSAQVSVVAKVSIPQDPHLVREALNYQRFDPHMSEHWTGYTVVRPLIHPTPMGAIVPNFYGYYVKDIEQGDEIVDPAACESSRNVDNYFSPIMLIEDCGTPPEISSLSLDDRRECAAMLLRFHHMGWTQGSFYPRNILMQRGDHADFPLMRDRHDKRFRLIDFGRAITRAEAESDTPWENVKFQEKNTIWQIMEFPNPM